MKKLYLLTLLPLTLTGCFNNTSDIDSYSKLLEQCREEVDFHSELYIFPDSTNIGNPTKFSYKRTPDLFTDSFLLYLVMEYDEVNYEEEIARLKDIKANFCTGLQKDILHYEEHNLFLTISRDKRYEYAVYNEEKLEIAYISNQLYSWTTAQLNSGHALPEITIPAELDDGENSYNIYYEYGEYPEGVQVGVYVENNC